MRVHHAHQGGTLAGKVLQAQQGDPAEFIRTHRRLDFRTVALQRIFPCGADHPGPFFLQSGGAHLPLHVHKIGGNGHAMVLHDLAEVREHFVLPDLKGEDRQV